MNLVVARVGRAHGLRGEVAVEIRTDEPDQRLALGAVLETEPASAGPLTIAAASWHSGRLLLRFSGVGDRGAAEALRGTLLLVEATAERTPSDPEEFYDHQLAGLAVCTGEGALVGSVREVVHLPGQDLLAVQTGPERDNREVLVPFVAAIVTAVDLGARRVVISPPAGLFDLDVGR